MTVDVTSTAYEVTIRTAARLEGRSVSEREWNESIPR
jgi:hypothetical protein